jgi:hypothetical protein
MASKHREERVIASVACPTCKAVVNQPCCQTVSGRQQTFSGRPIVHQARRDAWRVWKDTNQVSDAVELPFNAVPAETVRRIGSLGLGFPDMGIAVINGQEELMTWGQNFTRGSVEKWAGYRFVFTGFVSDLESDTKRENYERLFP